MGLFTSSKRKQFIIDAPFQFRYVITWLIMMLFFIAVVACGLMFGLKTLNYSVTYGLGEIGLMLKFDAVFIVLFAISIGIYFIILSHRIAGPAYRLEKSIQRMVQGDYDFSVTLRKDDYLQRVADDLNDLLGFLRENRGTLMAMREDIKALKNIPGMNQANLELINKAETNIQKILEKK